ncbi:glucose-1-phosphate thymidylyltransferase [Actinomadura harenae]|uniref:Glucose-1-phosphate thymidylyltransferase n=1 Tax=Actinomadura harenae TaxID=2483351 RepID=A0A3M2LT93_9ACTN|nr:glucose-1-phosphate thymidylyltransferase [Actinomadura harenae]RMI40719.1 glucose-1-phosphate thymidylyltransferase [Actinomadura harenae]
MKALVLAGGSGSRLRPLSHSMPKQLIPVAGRPVLEHVIADIANLGVTDVAVVVGTWATQIQRVLGDGSRLGVRLTYLRQDRPLGLAHALRLGRSFLGEDDFVMYLGDNVLREGVAEIAGEFRRTRPAAQLVVRKVADPRAYGVAEVDADGAVLRLVEKPEHPAGDLAVVGVYFFTPAIHDAVAAIVPSARGELEITDAVQWLVDAGADVRAKEYGGFWRDVGEIEHVLDCNRRLLEDLVPRVAGAVDAASELHGPVVVEEGASVVRSRIRGPAFIGAGTRVEDSVVGPGTAVGAGCLLRSASLADSIVLDGASIEFTGAFRRSVIGRSAVIGPGVRGRDAHEIVVGDHARVELRS